MKMQSGRSLFVGLVALALGFGLVCAQVMRTEASAAGNGAPPLSPSFGCAAPPTFDPTSAAFLSGDIGQNGPQQTDVNCFAWQSFIAFNWPVDAAWPGTPALAGEPDRTVQLQNWGTPQDPTKTQIRPTVWETFKSVQDIFVAPGKTPSGWGVSGTPPASCTGGGVKRLSAFFQPRRTLNSISKVSPMPTARLNALMGGVPNGAGPDEIQQAFGGWLTDQKHNLVWYERAVNRQEFQYLLSPDGVNADALYTVNGQTATATNSDQKHANGLSFPSGVPGKGSIQPWQELGAAEIKASWRILTNQPQLWPRYLLSQAYLVDPNTGKCTQAILGLVGLHIIRNTATFPNFMWSTFEHIDNAPQPDTRYPDPYSHPDGFSFYSANCTVHCTPPNQARVDHGKPLFPMDEPVQVVRTFPIAKEIAQLNLAVQQQIASSNKQSVFQYYQLVNVQWDQSPTLPITAPNQPIKLNTSSMTSDGDGSNSPVANTTLETYAQTRSCVSCHSGARIAGSPTLASDFSFAFLETQASMATLLKINRAAARPIAP